MTAVGTTAVEPTNTVNALNCGSAEARGSLNDSTSDVPLEVTVFNVGGAMSGPAVELLVTA